MAQKINSGCRGSSYKVETQQSLPSPCIRRPTDLETYDSLTMSTELALAFESYKVTKHNPNKESCSKMQQNQVPVICSPET